MVAGEVGDHNAELLSGETDEPGLCEGPISDIGLHSEDDDVQDDCYRRDYDVERPDADNEHVGTYFLPACEAFFVVGEYNDYRKNDTNAS